jgi:competence protein ComEC
MKNLTKIILLFLAGIAFFLGFQVFRADERTEQTKVYFFDVGQGDSILIQRGNYQILIDGGPDAKILSLLGKAMPVTDRKIERVVLTHPHSDHLAGLNLILERYEVEQIFGSGVLANSNQFQEFQNLIQSKKLSYQVPALGTIENPFANANFEYLWPGDKYQEKTTKSLNNSSIVNRFCYFEQCVLLTGDIETDEQQSMIMYYEERGSLQRLQSSLLKISHHGSRNGTNSRLLETIRPKTVVISVGIKNQFGHPHQEVLDLLGQFGLLLYRTDHDQTVEFVLSKDGFTRR